MATAHARLQVAGVSGFAYTGPYITQTEEKKITAVAADQNQTNKTA